MAIVYAVVARGTTVLAEFSAVTGNTGAVARRILEKLPDETESRLCFSQDRYIFHILRSNGITFLCMANETFGRRIPFSYLEDIQMRFMKNYGKVASYAPAYSMNDEFSRVLHQQMEFFSSNPSADTLNRVRGEVGEIRTIMVDNIEKILERGDRIELLVDKTGTMQDNAFHFRKQSKRLRRALWMKNAKLLPTFSANNAVTLVLLKAYLKQILVLAPLEVHVRKRMISFLDLAPTSKPESLDVNISLVDPNSGRAQFDVIIIGAGPAGLRLAEQVSKYGIKVCCVDPSPLSMWPNNYGVWVDEFENLGLEDCLDHKWPMACVHINDHKTKYLGRPYGRVSRKKLKLRLLNSCVENRVKFYKAKVWKVEHEEFESSIVCDDGKKIRGSLVVDASGFASDFIEYDKPRNHGYQIAHGVLVEVDNHPFDLDKMVLMDWRDSHLGNEPYLRVNNSKEPTFLYAMPFDKNLVFLEETSLVSRPVLSYMEVKRRMVARLRHLGIKVRSVIEEEKCVIPMGGPLPRIPQNVMAIGGNSGIVHPSTGYMVARSMALAPVLAEAIVEGLGSTRMIRGSQLYHRVWNGLWPLDRRCIRECYSFGMETLLKLDLKGTRRLFDAFFDLDPKYWQGFLSSRLSVKELALLSLCLFGHGSNLTRLDIVTKCPVPLVRLIGNLAIESI
ncbi:hypothetical protein KY289_028340 [Solanum tuberosum]|nr:hypothetical protein KY289_028340 [Solanum tuberosum]